MGWDPRFAIGAPRALLKLTGSEELDLDPRRYGQSLRSALKSKREAQCFAALAMITALSRRLIVGRLVNTSKSALSILSRIATPISQINVSSRRRSLPS